MHLGRFRRNAGFRLTFSAATVQWLKGDYMKLLNALLLGLGFTIFTTHAAELGDPAAELQIKKWVKGEPVKLDDDKKIYVVEFWATWCPPCRTSIPHLTEVQNRFKDKGVVIIGISDEPENTVSKFVDQMGSKMDYRVAIDDGRKTSAGYMGAYGVNGIPHAFIVKDQKVIWEGHPMAGLDKTLEQIVAGEYDIESAKTQSRLASLMDQFREAVAKGEEAEADKVAAEIKKLAASSPTLLPAGAFNPEMEKKNVQRQMLSRQFYQALASDNQEEAEKIEKQLKAIDPEMDLEEIRRHAGFSKIANEYFKLVTTGGYKTEAKKLGSQLAERTKGDAQLGNQLAWALLTEERIQEKDLALATQIAKQAGEDSKWEDPQILDTYARALFETGKKSEAVEYQKKAIAKASDDEVKQQLEETLRKYQDGK